MHVAREIANDVPEVAENLFLTVEHDPGLPAQACARYRGLSRRENAGASTGANMSSKPSSHPGREGEGAPRWGAPSLWRA